MNISCIVVDDDDVDRLTVLAFLEAYPSIEIRGSFDSSEKALSAIQKMPPEVLFLDIDMPGMNGLQLRKELMQVPVCIFITSYPEFAVDSFEMEALDFLVKPFSHERFSKTIERLKEYMTIRQKSELLDHTLGADTIFIKDGTKQVKLQLHEVIYLEAFNNYTSIITHSKKYTVLTSLSGLIKEKTFKNFIRIHRSYAVQKHFIKKIRPAEVEVENFSLPVGRSYKESLNSIII